MSANFDDVEYLDYEIDYKPTAEQASFAIVNERLQRYPGPTLLFDRANAAATPLGRLLQRLDDDRSIFASLRGKLDDRSLDPMVVDCATRISRFNKFRLDPTLMAQPSREPDIPSDPSPRLRYHGEELATTLFYLAETDAPSMKIIEAKIREAEPAFKKFEFNRTREDKVGFSVVYEDSREAITAARLSSGFLSYIGMIVLVATPNRPSVLMIEEPENGMTPSFLSCFYQAVRALAYNVDPSQRSQVILSSHSPFLICDAWNGDDRETIRKVKVVEGRAVVQPFAEVVAELGPNQLGRDTKTGKKTHLSLANAEAIMAGYKA